jgi:hypothetical protein
MPWAESDPFYRALHSNLSRAWTSAVIWFDDRPLRLEQGLVASPILLDWGRRVQST